MFLSGRGGAADAGGLEPPVARARSAPSIPQSLPRRELVTPAGRSPCRQALEHVIAAPLPPTESTRPSPGPLDDLSPGPLRRDCRGRLTGQVMGNVACQASPGRHHALNASRLAAGSLNDSMPLSGGPYKRQDGIGDPARPGQLMQTVAHDFRRGPRSWPSSRVPAAPRTDRRTPCPSRRPCRGRPVPRHSPRPGPNVVASVDLAAPPAPLSRQTAPSARTAPDIPAALRMGRGSGSVMFDAGRK